MVEQTVTTETSTTGQQIDTAKAHLTAFKANHRLESFLQWMRVLSSISPRLAVRVGTFLFLRPRRKRVSYLKQLPVGATRIHVVHNLRKLVGYRWGMGDKKILLVHGWESHIGHMLPLVQPLIDAGYQVVALDGPGHGQSPQRLTNMIDYGNAVQSALEQHGPFFAVIANSFGGAATSLMLAREPHIQIKKLVLLSPMNHIRQHIGIFEKILGYPPHMHERVVERINQVLPIPIDQCTVAEAVKSFKMPGLIVHDVNDVVIPAEGSLILSDHYAYSIFKPTSGLGHRGLVRNKKVQGWVLQFLGDTL